MVMTTEKAGFQGYGLEPPSVEEVFRASPEPGSYYRCPVSTPLHAGKRPPQQKIPESLTFVSLDFEKVENAAKPNVHKGMPAGRKILPRRKNMDYYYIDKEFQKRIAKQSNSAWLRSLCAQPVDEIFSKYRLLSEVKKQEAITRSYTTPGEKAIFEAWETNSSRRQSSAGSRASLNSRATTSLPISPQLTIVSKSYRKPQSRSDTTSQRPNSLVDSSAQLSPADSGLQTPVVSRVTPPGLVRSKTDKFPQDVNPLVEDAFYDQFKRQTPKLPELSSRRSYSFSPRQRKMLNNNMFIFRQASPTSFSNTVSPKKYDLSSSAHANVSLGDINENGGS